MLVMSRRAGQRVVIDGQVWITVGEVSQGGRVELLFEAPKHIIIDREEVHIKRQIAPRGKPNER